MIVHLDIERFTLAYIEALYFTNTGGEGQPPKDAEIDADIMAVIKADCLSFWHRFGGYARIAHFAQWESVADNVERAGQDFWLTRNGHGAGFWDGDWSEPYATILNNGAKSYGAFETYLTDAGTIAA